MKYAGLLVKLRPVTKSDYEFLYTLLVERDPRANISHHAVPSYNEHVKFINSKPYSKWYVLFYKNRKVGSVYLTKQNEVGVHIQKHFDFDILRKSAIDLVIQKNPRKRYLVNVSPKNKKAIRFLQKNGFCLIQHTYEFIDLKKH